MTGNYEYKTLPPFTKGELTKENWEKERKEILDLFRNEVYGIIPDESSLVVSHRVAETSGGFMEGKAIRKIIEITVKRGDREFTFPFYLFVPVTAEKKPAPVFLTLVNRSLGDADPSRYTVSQFWPAEYLISRGYAAAAIITQEIAPDYEEGFNTKFHRLFPDYSGKRQGNTWGSVTAWAWGMSRAVDYLVTDPHINGREIGIAGHSRGGKTSLWCGAQDERIALVISSCSGCTGTAITRGKTGEHIKDITQRFYYWFCENYKKYRDQEDTMPFDQHMLLGLIAPRLLYVNSRTQDSWCDPRAEFESIKQAQKVFGLYGKTDAPFENLPESDTAVISGNLAYHILPGEHNMDEDDWKRFLDFADRHFSH